MALLAHGSNMALAPTAAPLVQSTADSGGSLRSAIDVLARSGFQAVQLDAALPGLRPRDLGPRARRDLSALLARVGCAPAGLDLFIPRRHYTDPAHVDRAMSATMAAIELAADLGRLAVSLSLPVAQLTDDTRSALVGAADMRGIRLAIHAEDQIDELIRWITSVDLPALGAGVDPAAALGLGHDPAALTHRLARHLVVARLSDVIAPGTARASGGDGPAAAGVRCAVGAGDLDMVRYRIAVDLAVGRGGPIVLDLRGLPDPAGAATAARGAWEQAAFRA